MAKITSLPRRRSELCDPVDEVRWCARVLRLAEETLASSASAAAVSCRQSLTSIFAAATCRHRKISLKALRNFSDGVAPAGMGAHNVTKRDLLNRSCRVGISHFLRPMIHVGSPNLDISLWNFLSCLHYWSMPGRSKSSKHSD